MNKTSELLTDTLDSLSTGLPAAAEGAPMVISTWVKTTRDAGLEDVATELEMLDKHLAAGDGAHIAKSLSKLGKLTSASADDKDSDLAKLGAALSKAGTSLADY